MEEKTGIVVFLNGDREIRIAPVEQEGTKGAYLNFVHPADSDELALGACQLRAHVRLVGEKAAVGILIKYDSVAALRVLLGEFMERYMVDAKS